MSGYTTKGFVIAASIKRKGERMNEFRPYPKSESLKGYSQSEPKQPKYFNKRPKKRPKNPLKPEINRGVKIPSRANRSAFTNEIKMQVIDMWGNRCLVCGSPFVEFHHRVFRSSMGRNNPRNAAPLCPEHHRHAHENAEFAQELRQQAYDRYGPHFFYDKYDCWKKGLIERPTDNLFERYMEGQAHEPTHRTDEIR